MSHSLSILILSVLLATVPVFAQDSSDGIHNFAEAGWPTMTLFASLVFVFLSIFYGGKAGVSDWKGNGSALPGAFVILNYINFIMGIFLIFGPGAPNPQINIIGFQVIAGVSIGFYGMYTNLKTVLQASFFLTLYNILAILGLIPILGHGLPLISVNESTCIGYFGSTNPNFNRCLDTGYLQLLRTFGLFTLFLLCIQLVQLATAISDNTTVAAKANTSTGAAQPLIAQEGAGFPAQPYVAPSYQQQQSGSEAPSAPHPYAAPAVGGASPYQPL